MGVDRLVERALVQWRRVCLLTGGGPKDDHRGDTGAPGAPVPRPGGGCVDPRTCAAPLFLDVGDRALGGGGGPDPGRSARCCLVEAAVAGVDPQVVDAAVDRTPITELSPPGPTAARAKEESPLRPPSAPCNVASRTPPRTPRARPCPDPQRHRGLGTREPSVSVPSPAVSGIEADVRDILDALPLVARCVLRDGYERTVHHSHSPSLFYWAVRRAGAASLVAERPGWAVPSAARSSLGSPRRDDPPR
jgi:hypothetical protein